MTGASERTGFVAATVALAIASMLGVAPRAMGQRTGPAEIAARLTGRCRRGKGCAGTENGPSVNPGMALIFPCYRPACLPRSKLIDRLRHGQGIAVGGRRGVRCRVATAVGMAHDAR